MWLIWRKFRISASISVYGDIVKYDVSYILYNYRLGHNLGQKRKNLEMRNEWKWNFLYGFEIICRFGIKRNIK